MIRSMTGYGEAAGTTAAGPVRVEMRTVNHRYLNVSARLPSAMARWETELRDWLRGPFSRGHVNCTVRFDRDALDEAPASMRLDEDRVRGYLALFRELGDRYGVAGEPDLATLTRYSDIIIRDEDAVRDATEVSAEELKPIVVAAAESVVKMREEEGKRLEADLRERIAAIEVALGRVESAAPQRLEAERLRLTTAVEALLDGRQADPDRLAQEIAILAERWDVNEELVRFRSHNELFLELLDADSDEPAGKRLSFLAQEMNREVNTIGSKANDSGIAHLVVAIKDELDRVREQAENVE